MKTVVDWSQAPEWAKNTGTCNGVMNYWIDNVSYQLFLHGKNGRVFFSNYDSKNRSSFIITSERPEPKPVYTQSMHDKDIYESNNNGSFTIIERNGSDRVTVQFIKTGYTTVTTNQNVKNGQIKDKLRPSVYGVGFVGVGHYTSRIKGEISKTYQTWVSMMERCYSDLQGVNNPTYKGCTVCGDWHNFQLFAEWFNNNYIEGYHLDKDIKNKGNKMYSPFSCMFVSAKENIEQAHAKLYTMISPEGLSVDIYNMSKHCEEWGLSTSHMSSVVNGKRPSHKGWTLKPLTPPIELIDGERYEFESKQHGGAIGFYNSDNCRFINVNMSIRSDTCTNIKLLEVKS